MDMYGKYKDLEDDELVALAQNADAEAENFLVEKYRNFVAYKVRDLFIQGADGEDLIQEGLIGLHKGIHSYKKGEAAGFRGFADLCIRRQVITAMRAANRFKNQPLNNYVSIHSGQNGDENRALDEVLGSVTALNPEEIVVGREQLASIEKLLKRQLSSLEWSVFHGHLTGFSFEEMSGTLGHPVKSIYNAMERSRRKVEAILKKMDVI